MTGRPEDELWKFYMQLAQVEEAFKHLKSDLVLRPFHHQKEERIEAHIFVAFLAYCLQVTLTRRLKDHAPGLTARSVLEKLAGNANDRRALADHRRTGSHLDALHATGAGATAAVG